MTRLWNLVTPFQLVLLTLTGLGTGLTVNALHQPTVWQALAVGLGFGVVGGLIFIVPPWIRRRRLT